MHARVTPLKWLSICQTELKIYQHVIDPKIEFEKSTKHKNRDDKKNNIMLITLIITSFA